MANVKSAFVLAMVAQRPPSNPKRVTSRPTPSHNRRKRVRPSELTLKYRANATDVDEAMLVDDFRSFDAKRTHSQPRSQSRSQRTPQSSPYRSSVSFSRFPTSWAETVSQVTNAVATAAADGHDRIRVDVKSPELVYSADTVVGMSVQNLSQHTKRLARLVECACSVFSQYLPGRGLSKKKIAYFVPRKACLFFNSEEDAAIGRQFIDSRLQQFVQVLVLDQVSSYNLKSTISVIIAPSNQQGNPSHIEAVERVHYANWNDHKVVVLLNPDLVALTRFTSFGSQPRQPCFLGDYLLSYYLDPVAFPAKTATGAVLRCFPRKWEMYLLKVHSNMGFRLIAEQKTPPSPEKIRCEFSWRIENELETEGGRRRFSG
ncbi:hypothetical protein FGB62_17g439 [Gracilaria domingensis]|nr:hypothetical protein FGB62_17g439 [Gracilaria domingensis]